MSVRQRNTSPKQPHPLPQVFPPCKIHTTITNRKSYARSIPYNTVVYVGMLYARQELYQDALDILSIHWELSSQG